MISKIYEAFRDAGVSEDKALAAAEVLSSESTATKKDIRDLREAMNEGFLKLEARMTQLHWMLGVVLAFIAVMFWKLFAG